MRTRTVLVSLVVLLACGGVATAAMPVAQGSWTPLSVADPKYGGGFADVSCASTTACVAAGFKNTDASGGIAALVKRWNGSGLQGQTDRAGTVNGISCPTRTFCMAVGLKTSTGSFRASAARWNGTRWRALSLPSRRESAFESVSCWAGNRCVAVGSYIPSTYARPLIERWNGTAWHAQSAPTGSQFANHLSGVSCASRLACLAVGQTFLDAQGRDSRTLAERWNGQHWKRLSTPTLAKSTQPWLEGVSCVSAGHCVAVGGAPDHSLILLWQSGRFTRQQAAAAPPHSAAPLLTGVSCRTVAFCMATGTSEFPAGYRAERWDGSSWTMASMPGGGTSDNFDVMKISCPTTSMCLAAGMYQHRHREHVVIDRWTAS